MGCWRVQAPPQTLVASTPGKVGSPCRWQVYGHTDCFLVVSCFSPWNLQTVGSGTVGNRGLVHVSLGTWARRIPAVSYCLPPEKYSTEHQTQRLDQVEVQVWSSGHGGASRGLRLKLALSLSPSCGLIRARQTDGEDC